MGSVHDILVEDNYHDQTVAGGCALPEHRATCPQNLTITGNVLVAASGPWPAAAKEIEAQAGINP